MKELIICIFSSGQSSIKENIESTISSFEKNLGTDNHLYYIFVSNELSKSYYESILSKDKIFKIIVSKKVFADEWNDFVEDVKDEFLFALLSHDDINISTEKFYCKVIKYLNIIQKDNLGFITFSNNHYTNNGALVSNSLRETIHTDFKNSPKVFECHTNNINDLDYPKSPVMVYGPMPHIYFTRLDSLVKVGKCVNWSHNSLLIDENFCLETSIKKLMNIWIPDIFYQHPINGHLRNYNSIGHVCEVHEKFKQKWGVYPEYNEESINFLLKQYPDSFLSLFAEKKSYDWIYI